MDRPGLDAYGGRTLKRLLFEVGGDLRAIEDSLNGRPQMTLEYRTPADKYADVIVLST